MLGVEFREGGDEPGVGQGVGVGLEDERAYEGKAHMGAKSTHYSKCDSPTAGEPRCQNEAQV